MPEATLVLGGIPADQCVQELLFLVEAIPNWSIPSTIPPVQIARASLVRCIATSQTCPLRYLCSYFQWLLRQRGAWKVALNSTACVVIYSIFTKGLVWYWTFFVSISLPWINSSLAPFSNLNSVMIVYKFFVFFSFSCQASALEIAALVL